MSSTLRCSLYRCIYAHHIESVSILAQALTMSVSFAVLKAKDCTGTIGNGRPVIGRPVETPYRQSTMKARTSCAVLVCFLVCAASMKRVCPEPETQPPDQMQAQCEAPEVVLVATSKARPQGASRLRWGPLHTTCLPSRQRSRCHWPDPV